MQWSKTLFWYKNVAGGKTFNKKTGKKIKL